MTEAPKGPKGPLHLHPDIAQMVGLVVSDYALLEQLMYIVYAIMTGKPDEAFVEYYTLRSSHLREEKMTKLANATLKEPFQLAHKRLWRRLKAAAQRRAEIAHVTFLSDGRNPARMRLYGTKPHFEPLTPQVFERTFNQYQTLGTDILIFASLLSGGVAAVHRIIDQLPSAQYLQTLPEQRLVRPDPTKFEEDDIRASLVRLKLLDQVTGV